MKLGKIISAAALMLASATAMAQGPNYSYVQGGYQMLTGTDSPDGLFIEGSYQIADQFYLAGGYDIFSDDFYDVSRLTARGGYIHPMENNIHLYGEAGLAFTDAEFTFCFLDTCVKGSEDSVDLMIEGGVRAQLAPALEVRGALRMITGDYDETYLIGEGVYHFNPQLAMVGGLARMSDAGEFRVQAGLRFAF